MILSGCFENTRNTATQRCQKMIKNTWNSIATTVWSKKSTSNEIYFFCSSSLVRYPPFGLSSRGMLLVNYCNSSRFPRWKISLNFHVADTTNLWNTLDLAKISDLVIFLYDPFENIPAETEDLLSSLLGQGLPAVVHCLYIELEKDVSYMHKYSVVQLLHCSQSGIFILL